MFTSLLPPKQRWLRYLTPTNNLTIIFNRISKGNVDAKANAASQVLLYVFATAVVIQMLWYCEIGNSCRPAAIHGVVVLRNQARAQFPSRTRDLTNMAAQSGWLQLLF